MKMKRRKTRTRTRKGFLLRTEVPRRAETRTNRRMRRKRKN